MTDLVLNALGLAVIWAGIIYLVVCVVLVVAHVIAALVAESDAPNTRPSNPGSRE